MAKQTRRKLRMDVFAREYAVSLLGRKSAIAAGYRPAAAQVIASRFLADPECQALIAKYSKKTADKLEITAEKVLSEIARLAFLDPRKLFREDGSIKEITEMDRDTAAAIAGFDVVETEDGTRIKKFRLTDKGMNLERLGRHLKLFIAQVEVSGLEDYVGRLERARKATDA